MAGYLATIEWNRGEGDFAANKYSRAHQWEFDGGVVVPASASPHVVPVPLSDPAGIDPEESFVAAIASCHMLWFLDLARQRGFIVDQYRDAAEGKLEKNTLGKWTMGLVWLRPRVQFGGSKQPSQAEIESIHQEAHEECFIANSVNSRILIEPEFVEPQP